MFLSSTSPGLNGHDRLAQIKTRTLSFTLAALLLVSWQSDARSVAERKEFQRSTPCPSTGKTTGKCPGYVVDHIIPLCAGGADDPANMQWQELAASKAKDKQEWRQCRELKRAHHGDHQL